MAEDKTQDEIERAEGEALLRHFLEERKNRDKRLRALLSAAVAEIEQEAADGE